MDGVGGVTAVGSAAERVLEPLTTGQKPEIFVQDRIPGV
jgi:hypothetical protein